VEVGAGEIVAVGKEVLAEARRKGVSGAISPEILELFMTYITTDSPHLLR